VTYGAVTQAAHGTVTVNADGTFTLHARTPTTTASQLTFTANDGALDSNVATENLTVNFVNQARWASRQRDGNENAVVTARSPRAMVDGDALSYSAVTQAAHGTVTVNTDGTFSYTPNANYHGADSFTSRPMTGALDSNIATENLTVNFVNQPPVAQAGSASGNESDHQPAVSRQRRRRPAADLQCGHPGGARQRDGPCRRHVQLYAERQLPRRRQLPPSRPMTAR